MDTQSPARLRNLALYPIYVVCLNGFFWFPIFFLYFSDRIGLQGALFLEAVYYLAVVLFEVPSGWASDRFGRRFALRTAALLLGLAYLFFYVGDSTAMLAVAQVLLAAGFAFNSGTDTSFHYDSLVAIGREDEFADREERIARLSFTVVGMSALVGGLLGGIELRLPYLVSAVVMAIGFVVTLAFVPPEADDAPDAERLDRQLIACVGDLRDPTLGWLFGAAVLLTTVIHVPYQLYQPYLDLLDLSLLPAGTPTPAITGLHACLAMMVAAATTSVSLRFARAVGLRGAVLFSLLIGVVLVVLTGAFLHPVIAILLIARSTSRALIQAPMNAAIAPRVPQQRRASYLSMQSLAGRLGFSLLLFALSAAVGEGQGWGDLSLTAWIAGGASAAVWLLLAATSFVVRVEREVLRRDG